LDEKKPDTKASGRIMPPAHPLSNHGAQVGATVLGFTVTAMADMAALLTGFRGPLAVIGEIPAALLTDFMSSLRRSLAVEGEVSTTLLAALTPGLSGAFAVLGKIACSAAILSF
jgi:hypothetical protein